MGWIVSNTHKFIFIHIPKTGGSSIAEPEYQSKQGALVAQLGKDDHVQAGHVRAVGLKNRLGESWDSYFKFAFVRNPWDRMVSLYYYFLQDPEKQHSDLGRAIAKFSNFGDFCNHLDDLELDPHFDPQISYMINYEGEFLLDYVGRFENMNNDMQLICKIIGLSPVELPHFRKSRHDSYRSYYNDTASNIIGERYRADIDIFHYSF